jgi:hypothetical protein
MKARHVLWTIALVIGLAAPAFWGYSHFVLRKHYCAICERPAMEGHASTVTLNDGKKIRICCPRCAFHYHQNHPGEVSSIALADRATGRIVEAARAVYVEGSDDRCCVPQDTDVPREPGVSYDRHYDRCLPNLAAFSHESAAREFLTQHGGRLLSYRSALESVRER